MTLGETTFAECDSWGPPSTIWSYMYANRYCYSEAFYLPSAANSVTILLGNNYMGEPQMTNFDGLMGVYGKVTSQRAKKAAAGRSVNIVNTYGVCAPNSELGVPSQFLATKGWLGPDQWELGSTTLSDKNKEAGTALDEPESAPEANVVIEQASYSRAGGRWLGYGVVLHNTSALDARGVAVTVKFLSGSGSLLGTDRGWIGTIPAGATFYYGGEAHLPRGSTPETLGASAKADWSEAPTQQPIQTTDLRIVDDYGPTATGRITNTTDYRLTGFTTVYYVLFGPDGRVLSGGSDYLDRAVRPGDSRRSQSGSTTGRPRAAWSGSQWMTSSRISLAAPAGRHASLAVLVCRCVAPLIADDGRRRPDGNRDAASPAFHQAGVDCPRGVDGSVRMG